MAGSRRDSHRLRRRRNRWRVHQRICLGPVLRARAQSSSMSPPLPTSSESGCQHGQEPDRTRSIMRRRDAMPPLACFLVHVSCQQAPAATDTFSAVRSQHVHTATPAHCGSANGQRPGGTSQETGLRTRRHHQHHDPGAPDQPERHETPDPARSDAVNSRFQRVRRASGSRPIRL